MKFTKQPMEAKRLKLRNMTWMSRNDWLAFKKWEGDKQKQMMAYLAMTKEEYRIASEKTAKRKEHKIDSVLCYVIIGKTRKVARVKRNDPSIAYKIEGMYNFTWITWPRFKFDRYLTSFDV